MDIQAAKYFSFSTWVERLFPRQVRELGEWRPRDNPEHSQIFGMDQPPTQSVSPLPTQGGQKSFSLQLLDSMSTLQIGSLPSRSKIFKGKHVPYQKGNWLISLKQKKSRSHCREQNSAGHKHQLQFTAIQANTQPNAITGCSEWWLPPCTPTESDCSNERLWSTELSSLNI